MAEILELIHADDAKQLRRLAFRISMMLRGLIRRERRRAVE